MGNTLITPRPVGRPRKSGSKKTAFSCSILPETASEAIKIFGSIGKAVEWAVNSKVTSVTRQ